MLSMFIVYPAMRGLTSVSSAPLFNLASSSRLDTQTPFAANVNLSPVILLFLFCVFFRVLWIHLASWVHHCRPQPRLGSIPLFRLFFRSALCLFLGSLHAFGSLARFLALSLTMSAFPYREPASVSVFRARPHFSFLFPRSCRG